MKDKGIIVRLNMVVFLWKKLKTIVVLYLFKIKFGSLKNKTIFA